MGAVPKVIQPVKFFSGIILSKGVVLADLLPAIEKALGPVDFTSQPMSFSHYSDYYHKEMGEELTRYFISFRDLGDRLILPDLKIKSRSLEQSFMTDGKRCINLDPGYITLGQVFLASTKDNFCRIYLRDSIFAEVTLYYKAGQYQAFAHTYRDYAGSEYQSVLLQIRSIYKKQLDGL